jgi:hypothetical protein
MGCTLNGPTSPENGAPHTPMFFGGRPPFDRMGSVVRMWSTVPAAHALSCKIVSDSAFFSIP